MPPRSPLVDRLQAALRRRDINDLDLRDEARIAQAVKLLWPALDAWFSPVVRGLERIPDGPVLYVGNHNGATLTPDSYVFLGSVYRERGLAHVPYGLMHEVAIKLPGANQLFVPLGAVRASHDNAHRIFEAGHKVLVYPGGDLDAMRPYRHRDRVVFGPRRGYIRLALREGVPIVPVVAAGAHETFYVIDDGQWLARLLRADKLLRLKVFPITLSIPWGLTVGPVPPYFPWRSPITIEILDPIHFERTGPEAAEDDAWVERCHAQVLDAMNDKLGELVREVR